MTLNGRNVARERRVGLNVIPPLLFTDFSLSLRFRLAPSAENLSLLTTTATATATATRPPERKIRSPSPPQFFNPLFDSPSNRRFSSPFLPFTVISPPPTPIFRPFAPIVSRPPPFSFYLYLRYSSVIQKILHSLSPRSSY